MLPLFPPRRYRRPLLFPPGLLALAGLLWLGCVALPRIHPSKPRQTILEVAFYNQNAAEGSLHAYPTPRQVEEFGPWKSLTVSGSLWADYFEVRMVRNICLSLVEEQAQHRALHVYMSETTSYNTFIQLLEIPTQLGIKKYWTDLRKLPFSFNLLGNRPIDPRYSPFFCGTSFIHLPPQPDVMPWRPFSVIVAEWFAARGADLCSPDWRNTWLLLLLLSLLSGWRLVRQWRPAAA